MFSEYNYIQLQCPACKKIESVNVPYEKELVEDFPIQNVAKLKCKNGIKVVLCVARK